MVLVQGPVGGGIGGDVIKAIKPPQTQIDVEVANRCFKGLIDPPTVVYVPFDPTTGQIPPQPITGAWPWKFYGDYKVFYSPNLHKVMLKYYARQEGDKLYISTIPVLIVDYSAVIEALYYGPNRPEDRPLDWQFGDWKSGYMWSRVKLPREGCPGELTLEVVNPCGYHSPQFGCMPTTEKKTVKIAEGWWWVKYKAALIELPAEVLTTTANTFRFYYRKPPGVKTPVVGKIRDYLFKRKIKEKTQQLLSMVGWAVVDIKVHETSDGYIVEIQAVKVQTQAVPLGTLVLAAIIAVAAVSLAVFGYYLYKVEVERTRRYQIIIGATNNLGEQYQSCVEKCKQVSEQEACIAGCAKIYADTINHLAEAEKTNKSELSDIMTIMKWGIVAAVVMTVLQYLPKPRR